MIERADRFEAAQQLLLQEMSEGFKPPPRTTVSQWAAGNRILTKRESPWPGPWENWKTPYLVEPMDCLSVESPIRMVVTMKGGQIGGSEVGNNWVGYVMSHPAAAGPILMVVSKDGMARRVSRQRIDPMIRNCPALQRSVKSKYSREGGNTTLLKEFAGDAGILAIVGAKEADNLRQFSARYLFVDEPDAYDSDLQGEGDPMELILQRADAFGDKAKIYVPCTPTIEGFSRIADLYDATDQRRYNVPCLRCGTYNVIEWKDIKWTKGKPATAGWDCPECAHHHEEADKLELLPNGEWQATAECPPEVRGYHIPGLLSPYGAKSWQRCVEQFLRARKHADKREKMKAFTNLVLAQTFKDEGAGHAWQQLYARRERYPAEAPQGVLLIAVGVDVQLDRVEATAWGFGHGEEMWAIDAVVFHGDTDTPKPWRGLDTWLQRTYTHESGAQLPIAATAIDAGYRTETVLEFVAKRKTRNIIAVIGRMGPARAVVAAPVKKKRAGRGARAKPIQHFIVGSDTAKGLIYSRLALTARGPGYVHVPAAPAFEEEWCRQLCGERRKTEYHLGRAKHVWKQTYERVEALDCCQYALAAMYWLSPSWPGLARRLGTEIPKDRPAATQPAPVRKRSTRRGYATRWKD